MTSGSGTRERPGGKKENGEGEWEESAKALEREERAFQTHAPLRCFSKNDIEVDGVKLRPEVRLRPVGRIDDHGRD